MILLLFFVALGITGTPVWGMEKPIEGAPPFETVMGGYAELPWYRKLRWEKINHNPKKSNSSVADCSNPAHDHTCKFNEFVALIEDSEFPIQCTAVFLQNNPSYFADALKTFMDNVPQEISNQPYIEHVEASQSGMTKPPLYVKKLVLPAGSRVFLHGDLHGDIHSLVCFVQWLKTRGLIDTSFTLIKSTDYIAFLGDYVDRGAYGVEVIYLLLLLANANPEKVILIRGNHEEKDVSKSNTQGFTAELSKKLPTCPMDDLQQFYQTLPIALFLGCGDDFVQCCHGGLEIGYNPIQFLADPQPNAIDWVKITEENLNTRWNTLKRTISYADDPKASWLSKQYTGAGNFSSRCTGFMWNDFVPSENTNAHNSPWGAYLVASKKLTEEYLALCKPIYSPKKLRGVIRAHQHNGTQIETLFSSSKKAITRDTKGTNADNNPLDQTTVLMDLMRRHHGVVKLWDPQQHNGQLWDNFVITFLLGPDCNTSQPGYHFKNDKRGYPAGASGNFEGFDFSTFAELDLADGFENWRFIVHNAYPYLQQYHAHLIQDPTKTKDFLMLFPENIAPVFSSVFVDQQDTILYDGVQLIYASKSGKSITPTDHATARAKLISQCIQSPGLNKKRHEALPATLFTQKGFVITFFAGTDGSEIASILFEEKNGIYRAQDLATPAPKKSADLARLIAAVIAFLGAKTH